MQNYLLSVVVTKVVYFSLVATALVFVARRRPASCSTRASPRAPSSVVFQVADHVEVKGASLENGLLHVDLVRELPEAMKPRSIPIVSSSKLLEVKPTKIAA